MRILHTADWHLGKRLDSINRHDEQVAVLDEICQIADREAVDVVLIAGDLFDEFNPPAESEDVFYSTCKRLTNKGLRPVIAIAGNHDSPQRIHAPDPLARTNGIIFVGLPNAVVKPFKLPKGLAVTHSSEGFISLKLPQFDYPLNVLLTPYANESRLKRMLAPDDNDAEMRQLLSENWSKSIKNAPVIATKEATEGVRNPNYLEKGINILVSHLYFMKKGGLAPEEGEDGERSIRRVGGSSVIFSENVPPVIQYVALGHLHRQQEIDNMPCPIVYSGSPLGYSFAEEDQQKYVVIVDVEPQKKATYIRVPLTAGKRLLRQKFEDVDGAMNWLSENQNALVEVTIVSDTSLKGEDKRRMYQAHEGIVHIIPSVTKQHENAAIQVDLSKSFEDIFIDYFKHKKRGQVPNERILQLFKEVLSVTK